MGYLFFNIFLSRALGTRPSVHNKQGPLHQGLLTQQSRGRGGVGAWWRRQQGSNKEGATTTTTQGGASFALAEGVLASLCEIPKFLTMRIKGTIQGQRVSVLVDSGATHNFIDAQMVQRRSITTARFEGFSVLIPGERTMQCTRYVPSLTVTMGNYSMTDHFFVVDVLDTNVMLGVQWLYSLGRVTTNWKQLVMEFVGPNGKLVVLRGMHSYPPQTVWAHKMEADLRHGDIAWAVELRIS